MPKGVEFVSDEDSRSEMKCDNADTKFVIIKECESDNKKNGSEKCLSPLKMRLSKVSKPSKRKNNLPKTQNNVTPKQCSEINNFSDSTETKNFKQNDTHDVLSSKIFQEKNSSVKNSQCLSSNTKETFSQIVDKTSKLKVQLCDIFICTEGNCFSKEVIEHREALRNIVFLKGSVPHIKKEDKQNSSKSSNRKSGKTGKNNKTKKYVANTTKKANSKKSKVTEEIISSSENESNSERESSSETEAGERDSDWDNSGVESASEEDDDDDFEPSSKKRRIQAKKPVKKKPPSKRKKVQKKKRKNDSDSGSGSESESDSEEESSSKKGNKELSEYQKKIQKCRDEKMAFLKSLKIDQIKADFKEAASELKKKQKPKKKPYEYKIREVLPPRKNYKRSSKVNINLSEDYINQKAYTEAHREMNKNLREQREKHEERVRKMRINKEIKRKEQERLQKEKLLKLKISNFLTRKGIQDESQLEIAVKSEEFLNVEEGPKNVEEGPKNYRSGQKEKILEKNKKIALNILLERKRRKEMEEKRQLQMQNLYNLYEMKKVQELAKKQQIQPKITKIFPPQPPAHGANTSKLILQNVPMEILKTSTICVSSTTQNMNSPLIYIIPKPSAGVKPAEVMYLPKAPVSNNNSVLLLSKSSSEGIKPPPIPAKNLKNPKKKASKKFLSKVVNKPPKTILPVDKSEIEIIEKPEAILPKTPVEVIDVSDSENSDETGSEKPNVNVADFLEVKYD